MFDQVRATSGLLARHRRGSGNAANQLIDHYCVRLRRMAEDILRGFPVLRARGDYVDAAVNTAVHKLLKYMQTHTFQNSEQFKRIARIEVKRALGGLKKNLAKQKCTRLLPGEEVPDDRPGQLELLARFEVLDLIPKLEPKLREVVEMKWFDGASQLEIAERLKVDPRTVRIYQAKALDKLRRWMKE